MKVQDIVNEIVGYSNYVCHFIEKQKIFSDNTVMLMIEYWRKVGNSKEIVGYCRKYLVIDYGKDTEEVYEDKATPSQVVRARKW